MGSKIEYKENEIVGDNGIIFITEENIKPDTILKNKEFPERGKYVFRKALFRCKCGNPFVCRIDRIKSNYTKSCGCLRKLNGRKR